MSEANRIDLSRAAMDGANENGGMRLNAGGGGASDHGWQKVTNKKKLRRQAAMFAAAEGVDQAKQEIGKNGVGMMRTIGGGLGTGCHGWHKYEVPKKQTQTQQAAKLATAGAVHQAKQETAETRDGMLSTVGVAGCARNHEWHKLPHANKKRQDAAELAEAEGAQQREVSAIGGGECTSNHAHRWPKLPWHKLTFCATNQGQQATKSAEAGGAQHSELVVYNRDGTKVQTNSMFFGEFGSDLEISTTEGVAGDGGCSCLQRVRRGEALDGGCSSTSCWATGPFSFGSI